MIDPEDLRALRDDTHEMQILMRNYFQETDQRFAQVGHRLNSMAAEMTRLGSELIGLAANSEERWRQLAGRSRLMEELEERIVRLEQRLDPPAA